MTPGSSSLISSSSNNHASSPLMGMKKGPATTGTGSADKKKKMEAKKSPKVMGSETKGKGNKTSSPVKFGGANNRSPSGKKKSPPSKVPTGGVKVQEKEEKERKYASTSESEPEENEVTFEDYSELCERVAKTMYYSNTRPPTTPRPSLPLTILAVDTFSKFARKDTLEFLDIDMAAEIGRNACVSPTALVFALVYLERLSVNNPGYLKTVKPSELFVVSLLVASKFIQDDGEDLGIFNDEWATSANMELKKINKLELEFLTAIDWHINIGKAEYERALKGTEEKIALYQGAKRGWYTYTELKSLTNTHLTWNAILPILYERVVEVVSGICVMYTTFFATLITSSVLAPYLLSVSKLVLMSSITNSLMTSPGSSLSSCAEDLSNASMPMSARGDITSVHHVQTPLPSIPGLSVPAHHIHQHQLLLASLDEEENSTDSSSQTGENPKLLNNVRLHHQHHRRGYETASASLGYSFKCESNYNCHHHHHDPENNLQDEALLQNVQRVLENLLHSNNINNRMPNSKYLNKNRHHFQPNGGLHCAAAAANGLSCPAA